MLDVANIRRDFPILASKVNGSPLVYFDNSATSQKPQIVIDALMEFYSRHNSNIHRGVHHLSEVASGEYESSRVKVADHIKATRSEEVVFTNSTTGSINLLADSLSKSYLREGDEIIVTELEHHSNLVPWQMACESSGAKLKMLPVEEDGSLSLTRLEEMIGERTKVLAVSHVSNVLGIVNPVDEIGELANDKDVIYVVDAAQSVPHLNIDVQEMGCDFLAFSGHKVLAESGIGVLYGKEERLQELPPSQGGGGMVKKVSMKGTTYADPPLRFEAGTPNISGALSLAVALDYMQKVGMSAIMEHEERMTAHMLNRLMEVEGLSLYGTAGPRVPLFSFNINGIHHYDLGLVLDKMGIAVRTGTHCAEPLMERYDVSGMVRASLAFYNTIDEIDKFFEALEKAVRLLG